MIIIRGDENSEKCQAAKTLAENWGFKCKIENVPDAGIKHLYYPQIWWNKKYIGGYEEFTTEIENVSGGFGDGKI